MFTVKDEIAEIILIANSYGAKNSKVYVSDGNSTTIDIDITKKFPFPDFVRDVTSLHTDEFMVFKPSIYLIKNKKIVVVFDDAGIVHKPYEWE
jgi:hypothetical protein